MEIYWEIHSVDYLVQIHMENSPIELIPEFVIFPPGIYTRVEKGWLQRVLVAHIVPTSSQGQGRGLHSPVDIDTLVHGRDIHYFGIIAESVFSEYSQRLRVYPMF